MCLVPDKDLEEEDAPIKAIRKMNQMVKYLINKLPSVKLRLWNHESGAVNKFITELPEDVDIVERYTNDFIIFISPGKDLYCRLNVFNNCIGNTRFVLQLWEDGTLMLVPSYVPQIF